MRTDGGRRSFSSVPLRRLAYSVDACGCSGHSAWVPVTLVIFWVCEVVEKVVEKTIQLAFSAHLEQSPQKRGSAQKPLYKDLFFNNLKKQQIIATIAKLSI
jgi:hypothetical protein